MSLDVQLPELRAPLDALNPTPTNFDLPKVDSGTLSYVYPISAEFMTQRLVAWRADGISLNGALADIQDDSLGTDVPVFDVGALQVATQGRYYTSLRWFIAGATVSPIDVIFNVLIRDAAGVQRGYEIRRESSANPGDGNFGPIYVPPGTVFEVVTGAVGGAGDVFGVRAMCLSHDVGNPVALIPGVTGGESS